jgi:hypothetical protein
MQREPATSFLTMTTAQLINSRELLNQFAELEAKQQTGVLPLPGDARLKLCNITCEFETAYAATEKARNALVKQFGTEQPDKTIRVLDAKTLDPKDERTPELTEKWNGFVAEYEKLLNSEAKVDFEPLTLADLAKGSVPIALASAFVTAGLAKK